MKKIVFVIIVIGFIAGIFCLKMFDKKFALVTAEDTLMKQTLEDVVKILNKHSRRHALPFKKIDFYAGNFNDAGIPDVLYPEHTNILWLGSRRALNENKLSQYDFILVSTFDLHTFMQDRGVKSFYIPMFVKNMGTDKHNNCYADYEQAPCYWAVIGDMPEFTEYLTQQHIPFKTFAMADMETSLQLEHDFNHLSGVATSNANYIESSLDISPFYLMTALQNIPLVAYKELQEFNYLSLFLNNTIHVYSEAKDIPLIFEQPINTENAQATVKRFYTANEAAEHILRVLFNEQYVLPALDNLLTIWTVSKPVEYSNGDFAFANDLSKAFVPYFKYQQVTFPASFLQHIGKVNIYLRGVMQFFEENILPDRLSLMYIIYPAIPGFKKEGFKISVQEYVTSMKAEIQLFDAAIVASKPIQQALEENGVKAHFVPQFTNPKHFYPEFKEDLQSDVLFVGSNYFARPTVPTLLKHGINVTIYGPYWGDLAKGDYIDNRVLNQYYSSAKIVLNDTRPDMRQLGFVSNRIFDATACGTLVISDYMPEIEEIYGDAVPMWKTEEELVQLVRYYLSPEHEAERKEKAERARQITLENFTVDKTAQKIHDIISELQKDKN